MTSLPLGFNSPRFLPTKHEHQGACPDGIKLILHLKFITQPLSYRNEGCASAQHNTSIRHWSGNSRIKQNPHSPFL